MFEEASARSALPNGHVSRGKAEVVYYFSVVDAACCLAFLLQNSLNFTGQLVLFISLGSVWIKEFTQRNQDVVKFTGVTPFDLGNRFDAEGPGGP